jgi:hypothetical protein
MAEEWAVPGQSLPSNAVTVVIAMRHARGRTIKKIHSTML